MTGERFVFHQILLPGRLGCSLLCRGKLVLMAIVSAFLTILDILESESGMNNRLRSYILVARHRAGPQLDVFVLYISKNLDFGRVASWLCEAT